MNKRLMLGFVFVILLSSFIIVKGAEEVIEIEGSFCGILIGDNEIYSTRTSTENECEDALQEALPTSCNELTDWIRVNHPDISIPSSGLEFGVVYGDTVEVVTCGPTDGEVEVIEIKGSFCGILIGDNEIYSTRTSTENECEDALQEALPRTCSGLIDWVRENFPSFTITDDPIPFSVVYGDTVEVVTCHPTDGEVEVEVEVTEGEGIFQICGGCDVDRTCYPLGYRKSGDYCSDNREFVVQLEGNAVCENSFECGSNVCVSGQCVEAGLIQRILNWFNRLFGG